MSTRLLVIGLDGGTFDLLLPLVEQGVMPQLGQLLEAGGWGRLESTVPPFTAAAWSTFATGKNPGEHGIVSFEKRDRADYYTTIQGFNDARQLKRPLWSQLSDLDQRVAVINVPLSYPARAVNGLMITGMMTPANAPAFTYPPELANELPDYRIDVAFVRDGDDFRRYGLPPKPEMLADIRIVTEKRTAVCQQLLSQEAWDCFMVVYTGTDRISHFFWDDLRPVWENQPLTDPDPLLADLLAYFRQLDDDIATLVAAAGPDAHLLFMSDHGFGEAPTKRFAVNLWLEQLGLLQPNVPETMGGLAYWRMKIGRQPLLKKVARTLMPQRLQDQLAEQAQAESGGSDINWATTQAFFVPIYFHVCGVEINRVGLHRDGVVAAAAQYEAVREQIIAAAQELRDPETGEQIVDLAVRREAIFSGAALADLPDVIVLLKPDYIGGQSLAGSQLIEGHAPFRSGEHRADGIFAAVGPRIVPQADLPNLHLADVTATLLYLLGAPVPTDLDGHILQELFAADDWQQRPPVYQESSDSEAAAEADALYTADEEAALREQLRSLGYME